MTQLLRVESVTRQFGDVYGLDDVTLTIERGEFIGVVGRSGSGKSTLMNVLGLLDRPDTGKYFLDGIDTGTISSGHLANLRAQYLGFVFQSFHLQPRRSVVDNVQLGALYAGVRARERRRRALTVLDDLGLLTRADEIAAVLSGGERQRVAIARAILSQPAVLLCDEPTGNLDSENAAAVVALLGLLRDGGTTVLIVTHDRDVATQTDRQIHMLDGQAYADASH